MKTIWLVVLTMILSLSFVFAQRRNRAGNDRRDTRRAGNEARETADLTQPGRHDVSVQADGVTRWFIVYVPKNYNSAKPIPLVFAFHGGSGGMNNLYESREDLRTLADSKNFLAVFPNGQDGKDNLGSSVWNAVHCCGDARTRKSDVEFVRVMLQTISARFSVDRQRIHAIGFSNGGMLTHRLAAEMPEVFASVATMGATIGGHTLPSTQDLTPTAKAPIPIMIMHGTSDTRVNYNGGFSDEATQRYDLSFKDTVGFWVKANSCGATPKTETRKGGKGDLTFEQYPRCASGADVLAVSLQNVRHGWLDRSFAGFDGTGRAVEFFAQHPKR